jgi:hypothetical protein
MSEVGHGVLCRHGYKAWNDAIGEEGMVDDIMEGWPLLRIWGEDLLHKLASIARYFTVCGEFILVVTNTPDGRSIIRCINDIQQRTYK